MVKKQWLYIGIPNSKYVFIQLWSILGVYDIKTLLSLCLATYMIFIVTSLADTPFLYIVRRMAHKFGLQEPQHKSQVYRYLER